MNRIMMINKGQMIFMAIALIIFLPVFSIAGTVDLSETGQTTSYDANSPQRDDGAIQAGLQWPVQRFTDNGDGTVTDNLTGLMWVRDAGTPTVGLCTVGTMAWQDALTYVACLNTNNYLGYTDWRLPNVNELESLINAEEADSGIWLNAQGFINVQSNVQAHYWSSTTYVGNTASAWVVHIFHDDIHSLVKTGDPSFTYYVWPVRGNTTTPAEIWKTGQTASYDANAPKKDDGALQMGVAWPSPRFTDNGDGTVTDDLTGIMWVRNAGTPMVGACTGGIMTWQDALTYVACLNANNYLGYTDWRLSNRKELYSLIDFSQSNPALPTGSPFQTVQSSEYWSSTTEKADTGFAWYVDMSDGSVFASVFGNDKTQSFYVWPVRAGLFGDSDISVLPNPVDFGNKAAGSSSDLVVTVTNDSAAKNLVIGSIGLPSAPFSIEEDNCSDQSILPSGNCTITVRFSPTLMSVSNKGLLYAGTGVGFLFFGIVFAGGAGRRKKMVVLLMAAVMITSMILVSCGDSVTRDYSSSFDISSNDPDTPTVTVVVNGSSG